mgnify:CR=1 FL=1
MPDASQSGEIKLRKVVNGKVYGQTIIRLPTHKQDIIKLKKYLDLKEIIYEEVDANGMV